MPGSFSRAAAALLLRTMYSFIKAPAMSVEALKQIADSAWLAGHHVGKDRGCFQSNLLDEMAEDDNALGGFLRGLRVWSDKVGEYVNRFANVNHGAKNTGSADNGKKHTDTFTEDAELRLINYYMGEGQTGCLTVFFRGHRFEIDVPKGCAIVCCKELLEECEHMHAAQGRNISIVTEVKGNLPLDASEEEQCEAGTAQEVLPLLELFSPWQLRQPVSSGRGGSAVAAMVCRGEACSVPRRCLPPSRRFHVSSPLLLTTAGPTRCSWARS